jgi:hypothetical protein
MACFLQWFSCCWGNFCADVIIQSYGEGSLSVPPSSKKRADFFIVGAPKSGTTALDHYLSAHPDIFMAKKEIHYFGSDLAFGPQIYRRDLAGYLAEFNGWNGQRRAGEASVWYLFSNEAAAEIKTFNPEARIIIMLREPIAMLYSLYNQFRFDGNEPLASFEEALAAQDDRSVGRRMTRRTYFPQGLAYYATACYTEQVRRYFNVFGRERVHVIIYDDFVTDIARTYRNTLNFLEVDPDPPQIPFTPVNESMSVKSSLLRNILNDPMVRGTAIALRPWVPQALFAALQKLESKFFQLNKKTAKRSPLPPELQFSLREKFAQEIERLSDLLGRDLTHWSKSGSSAIVPLNPLQAPARSTSKSRTS